MLKSKNFITKQESNSYFDNMRSHHKHEDRKNIKNLEHSERKIMVGIPLATSAVIHSLHHQLYPCHCYL